MCHEICAATDMFNFCRLEPDMFNFFLFSPAGEDKLVAAVADVAKEIKEILYICKWVTGNCAVLAVLCGVLCVINAWRQWRK